MTVIVQLSDTHLLAGGAPAYGRVDTLSALRRAARHIADLDARLGGIDAVVVSGDLADKGEPEAYALFREAMAEVSAPLFAIPGNHDARAPFRDAFGGPDGETLDFAADVGALTLIGLDTSAPGFSHGVVSAAQCAWLDSALAARPERPAILFLHHPPFETGIGHMDAINLRAADALAETVARHETIRLVACGHVHRTLATVWAGRPAMIAPAPCHAVRLDTRAEAPAAFDLDPGAVLVHRWTGAGLSSQTSFIDAGSGPYPFVDA